MQVVKGTLHRDDTRDNYWARILFKSPENKGKTFLYLCASHEYLNDALNVKTFTDKVLQRWIDDVVVEWTAKGDSIFKKPFHLEVRAITEEGQINGLTYLKKKVVPTA